MLFAFSTKSVKSVCLTTTGLLLSLSILSPIGWANSNTSQNIRQGLPGRRISGGVRMAPPSDSCFTDFGQSLVSIMPRSHVGTTAQERPDFWFSIPDTAGSKTVEFQLKSEDGELLYGTQVDIADSSGVSEFQLPKDAPTLAIDKNYRWSFSLACNNGSQSPQLGLEGWVKRVAIDTTLEAQLATASAQERIMLYRSVGLWHEQVSELMNLRRQQEGNSQTPQLMWNALIESIGLTSHVSTRISERMSAVEVAEPNVTGSL